MRYITHYNRSPKVLSFYVAVGR